MARKRLLWQLYPSYLLVAATALVAVLWYAAYLLEKSYVASLEERLRTAASLLGEEIGPTLAASENSDNEGGQRWRAAAGRIASQLGVNLAVTGPGGEILHESYTNATVGPHRAPDNDAVAGLAPAIEGQEMVVRHAVVHEGQRAGEIRAGFPPRPLSRESGAFSLGWPARVCSSPGPLHCSALSYRDRSAGPLKKFVT